MEIYGYDNITETVNGVYCFLNITYKFKEGLAVINDFYPDDKDKRKLIFKYQSASQNNIDIHIKIKKDDIDPVDNKIMNCKKCKNNLFEIDSFMASAEYTISFPKSVHIIFNTQNKNNNYNLFDGNNISDHMTMIKNREHIIYTIDFPASHIYINECDIKPQMTNFPIIKANNCISIIIKNYSEKIKTDIILTKLKSNKISIYRSTGESDKDKCIISKCMKYIIIDLNEESKYIINVPNISDIAIYLANGDIQYINPSDGHLYASANVVNIPGELEYISKNHASWFYTFNNHGSFNDLNSFLTNSKFITNNGKIYLQPQKN